MFSPLILATPATEKRPHHYGFTGFNYGDGKVIIIWLGPFLGRVSIQARWCLKLQYSGHPSHLHIIISLPLFKQFPLSVLVSDAGVAENVEKL